MSRVDSAPNVANNIPNFVFSANAQTVICRNYDIGDFTLSQSRIVTFLRRTRDSSLNHSVPTYALSSRWDLAATSVNAEFYDRRMSSPESANRRNNDRSDVFSQLARIKSESHGRAPLSRLWVSTRSPGASSCFFSLFLSFLDTLRVLSSSDRFHCLREERRSIINDTRHTHTEILNTVAFTTVQERERAVPCGKKIERKGGERETPPPSTNL